MASSTSDRDLIVKHQQQSGDVHDFGLIKERIKILLLNFPMGIELEKFSKQYLEAFGEEFSPQSFGFQNLMEMFKSLCEMIELKRKRVKERKVVILKSSGSKGKMFCTKIIFKSVTFLHFI